MPEKTKGMYEALKAREFNDGNRTEALAWRLRQGEPVRNEDMYNVFERAAYESSAGLAACRDALLDAGAEAVQVAGAGPALFAVYGSREEAEAVAAALAGSNARVFVARTAGSEEATRVVVTE
jgi:4-diphosphocytidyl-2C-methyl-D-erythritol kinase